MAEDLEGRRLLSGGLDPTYGVGGIASPPPPADTSTTDYSEDFHSIALQGDKVLIAGGLTSSPVGQGEDATTDMLVLRLNTDGSLDTSFGSGGTTTIPVAFGGVSYLATAEDIAVQPDGKIDVLGDLYTISPGYTQQFPQQFVVAQLNPDGSLDTTFGTGGLTLIDFGPGSPLGANPNATAMAIGPDGKIVVTGDIDPDGLSDWEIAIARLNTDGTLDTSFNGTGMTTLTVNTGGSSPTNDYVSGVMVQPDDKVVIVGQADLPTNGQFYAGSPPADALVARLNADGTLDTSFNGTGELLYSYDLDGDSDDTANAVALDGSQIVVAGTSSEDSPGGLLPDTATVPDAYELTVTCLNADGTFDTSFNGTGKYAMSLGQGGVTSYTSASALTVLSDGSLLVGGSDNGQNNAGTGYALLADLTPNGTLNATYGDNGVSLIPTATVGSKLLVQSDGMVLFATNGGVARTTAPPVAAPTPPVPPTNGGGAGTTTPPLTVTTTTIMTTRTAGKTKASGISLAFDTGINPSVTTSLSDLLVRPMKGKKAIKIKKSGISYNAATRTLTINFARKTAVGKGFQLLITPGGIVATDGQVLFNGAVIPILITPTV